MSDEKKNTTVNIFEDYYNCLDDSCQKKLSKDRRPKGYVEIYDGDNFVGSYEQESPIVEDDNLVVYPGREWVLSCLFDKDNTNITATKSERLYWFGVGEGGAPSSDPLDPESPDPTDDDLEQSVMINTSSDGYGDYRDDPDSGYYKKKFSSVEFQQDEDNDDYYLIAKVNIFLNEDDANDSNISEAGLFTAESDENGHDDNFTIFSRITFPTIVKSSDRQLTFIWYIYS